MASLLAAGAGCTTVFAPPPQARARANYGQGALAYQQGDRDAAARDLRAAVAEDPNLVVARFLLGKVYKDQGDYRGALDQYKRVVELDPSFAAHHYNLGLMHHLLNELEQAANCYVNALKVDPRDYKANMNLGLVYAALDRPAEGLPYARRAVELEPKSAETHSNLAVVLESAGNLPAAEEEYRKAMELDADRVETFYNLGANLMAQGKATQAVQVYETILKKTDSSMARERYGRALLAAKRNDDAVRQFNAALDMNEGNWRALNGLGEASVALYKSSAHLDETKRTAALEFWKRSLAINPDQPRVSELVKTYSATVLFPE